MKKEKNKKPPRVLKIGKVEIRYSIADIVVVVLLAAFLLLSSNLAIITTARYGQGTEAQQADVITAFGSDNTEERFEVYFQWFNVLHELGHGVLRYNGEVKLSGPEEELLVNEFAAAYWQRYGEAEKLELVRDIADYAVANIVSDAPADADFLEYAEENWKKNSFFQFNNYGWFQFRCVKYALENEKSLEEVLEEMGIDNYSLNESELLIYPEITEESCDKIIADAVDNIHAWGLEYPEYAHVYSNDPNSNSTKFVKDLFGIIKLSFR